MREFLIQFVIGISVSCIVFYFFNKSKKIYVTDHDYGWLDIKNYPIPEDGNLEYLATDGKKVKDCCCKYFDKYGNQVLTSYNKEKITHWFPYPLPPKK